MADIKKADDVATVSAYIIAFAGAAGIAQTAMSKPETPMAIKDYRFKINLASDVEIKNETDIGLTVYGIKVVNKLTAGYTRSLGVEIECTIVPLVTLVDG